jgi:essential nuclear protein 1
LENDVMQDGESDEDYDDDVAEEEGYEGEEELVEFDGEYVEGANLTEAEEELVNKFLHAGKAETRTLADIIMGKIREKEENVGAVNEAASQKGMLSGLPPKVQEVYTSVGKMLAHYKSGKLPKALKMLPHLRNWEEVLWLTRPDEWSSSAAFVCTRIFASNLNEKMTQRFLNLVLLEKCRDDIRRNNKLNYHLYMALKKALFKPAAFYKGFLLPLALSRTCTLREALIIGSVLAKVSIPSNHSSAALLKLAEMPYSGSTSIFIRILLNKKYALPRRVVDSLVSHFCSFENETRILPVS